MAKISFGQALLLLIDKYKEDKSTCTTLKQFYIQGVVSSTDLDYIEQLFKESQLTYKYKISYSKKDIDEDASRRYFETHLAFETLLISLDQMKKDDILQYNKVLYDTLPEVSRNKFNDFIDGKISPKIDGFATEYMDAFQKVQHHENYQRLSKEQKEKVLLILRASWIGVLHARNPEVPVNLYGTGFFSEQNRGRVVKDKPLSPTSAYLSEKSPFFSNHFGLMKTSMPMPRNDIAYAESGFSFVKPSDQNTYDPEAAWPVLNFSKLVHPFSCSISGTTLCQLRLMIKLQDENKQVFDTEEKFANFLKCFMSILLFNSGGHVFNEFLGVLEIAQVREKFTFINGFEQINATSLLLNGNEDAFDKALGDTLNYTKVLLAKKAIHEELDTLSMKLN
ncbi:hypothetical protein DGG96_14665 [Legionella qingyii]|uniref:Type IV secretion protein Dot n=1 Tax=Legionella qingyii TaxID=2184757 RepID=A0A317U2Y0_9GAMM|nr:hypothetical protein [Legionella qingyii]PWY54862.1 hypothetical protein DGG96_14665 [Legionella qingyii]RUR20937.1 hypothetical protein ELY20_14125 [Legionella qingyii]RUR23213.1 hypothetical protein ELY16_13540 [Legionella qingyii]